MSKFQEYALEELCSRITSGGTPSTRNDKFYGGDIPWLRTQEVDFNFIEDTEIKITEEGLASSSAKWIDRHSVIVAMYGNSAGRVAITNIRLTTNQACCNLTVDESKADYRYVYYYLRNEYSTLFGLANGGAQQNLNAGMLKAYRVFAPNLSIQNDIAEILSSLDEKIELNRKQNRTLEAIAQALFKRWFVEFEFPDENGRPYKSSGGAMQPTDKSAGEPIWTAESRPEGVSAMDGANQLGEMEHVPLSDIVELNPRCALKKGELATYVEMKALPTSGMSVSEVIKKEFSGGAKFSRGDTLLARITPCLENGKTAYVDFLEDGEIAFGSTEFIVMRAKRGVSPQFVYCLAREPLFRQYAIKSMVGSSGRQRVQVDQIAKFPVLRPTPELMQQFDDVTKPLFDKISCNRKESFTLSNLRDTLLPKLMSGELRVGVAA